MSIPFVETARNEETFVAWWGPMQSTRMARLIGLLFPPVLIALVAWFLSSARLSALPREVRSPLDNPATPEKIELGRLLFWDPVLSGANDVACATCHHPDFGYAENLDISIGAHGVGLGTSRRFAVAGRRPFVKRNSLTVLNAAFNGIDARDTYDPARADVLGRAREEPRSAGAGAPESARRDAGRAYPEAAALDTVVSRLRAVPEYHARFTTVFGGTSAVSAANLGRALAAFERTLVATDTPFDRHMRGDRSAMTPLQVRGMKRFARIGCANCHAGPMFSDYQLHVLGVPDNLSSRRPTRASARSTGSGRRRFATFATPRRTCTAACSPRSTM